MTDAARRGRAKVDVLHTMDAQVWAQEFIRLFAFRKQDIDEGLMLSWFANAIMEGFDEANRRNATALADERRRALEEAAKCVPTNWCDPLLTGPKGIDAITRDIDCRVIEQLLRGIQDRIRAQAQADKEG